MVANRGRVFSWLNRKAPGFMQASYEGFYFDRAYSVVLHRIFGRSPGILERYDRDSEILGHAVNVSRRRQGGREGRRKGDRHIGSNDG